MWLLQVEKLVLKDFKVDLHVPGSWLFWITQKLEQIKKVLRHKIHKIWLDLFLDDKKLNFICEKVVRRAKNSWKYMN
jgi:hypothetical protein